MPYDLPALLGPDGVARTADLARRVDRHTVSRWVSGGRLIRLHPGVVMLAEQADDWRARAIAGVLASRGVLSHVSALAVWRLAPREGAVHVSVPARRSALSSPGLVVHRVRRLDPDRVGGLPVTDLPRALVDTWGFASGVGGSFRAVEQVRHAVIETLRDRRVHSARLRTEIAARPALPGRAELLRLIELVENGCQSELEIWGVEKVLIGRDMPRFVQQHQVVLPFGRVHLDAAVPELRIAIELDGAAFHGSREARERDTRRDVALAALGWVVLRFSYRRLVSEAEACRREIRQVCAARRAMLLAR